MRIRWILPLSLALVLTLLSIAPKYSLAVLPPPPPPTPTATETPTPGPCDEEGVLTDYTQFGLTSSELQDIYNFYVDSFGDVSCTAE